MHGEDVSERVFLRGGVACGSVWVGNVVGNGVLHSACKSSQEGTTRSNFNSPPSMFYSAYFPSVTGHTEGQISWWFPEIYHNWHSSPNRKTFYLIN